MNTPLRRTLSATGVLVALQAILPGMALATSAAVHNDVDGDGRSDLIWQHGGTGSIMAWSGGSAHQVSRISVSDPAGYNLAPLVLRSSGNYIYWSKRVDLILQHGTDGSFHAIYPDYAKGGYLARPFWTHEVASSDWVLAGSADFGGDGLADTFFRNTRTGANLLILSDWLWEYGYAPPVPNLDWKIMGTGDFDGDGRSDLLWRNVATGANRIWRGAQADMPMGINRVEDLDWRVAGIGDFNGDGRSDIFWRHVRTGNNSIWLSGNVTTRQPVARVPLLRWIVASVGDFNGDGRSDVLWRNMANGSNVIWKSADATDIQRVTTVTLSWRVLR